VLLTVDPVSRGEIGLTAIRKNVIKWIDVAAMHDSGFGFSEGRAIAGGQWSEQPKPFVDVYIVSPDRHGEFGDTMNEKSAARGGNRPITMIMPR
jgi:hypothetical protein